MKIRKASLADAPRIREIYMEAFDESEQMSVASLSLALLSEASVPPTIALVAEVEGCIAGHIAFSPLQLKGRQAYFGYILAPLAVLPQYQKRGIGSRLVTKGLEELKSRKALYAFVYGDPCYYQRFGFKAGVAERFTPPYSLTHPEGWLALGLDAECDSCFGGAIGCVRALRKPELW